MRKIGVRSSALFWDVQPDFVFRKVGMRINIVEVRLSKVYYLWRLTFKKLPMAGKVFCSRWKAKW